MTVQDVYNAALALLDEVEDNDGVGAFRSEPARDFKVPYIVDGLQREIAKAEGVEPSTITALTDDLVISDDSAMGALKFGLMEQLALGDSLKDEAQMYHLEYLTRMSKITSVEDFEDDQNVLNGFD